VSSIYVAFTKSHAYFMQSRWDHDCWSGKVIWTRTEESKIYNHNKTLASLSIPTTWFPYSIWEIDCEGLLWKIIIFQQITLFKILTSFQDSRNVDIKSTNLFYVSDADPNKKIKIEGVLGLWIVLCFIYSFRIMFIRKDLKTYMIQ